MRRLLTIGAFAVMAFSGLEGASAQDGGGSSYGRGSYGDYNQRGRASSYINPDTGAATANPDVNPNSNCFTPDQYETQKVSPAGTTTNNVHNDACFINDGRKVDGPASFQSSGAGFISACPDPDGAGPKVATLSDTNGDGRNDLCFQSGYQEQGIAGDKEFHARLNNTVGAGTQKVVWCADADANGCGDEWNKSRINIYWVN